MDRSTALRRVLLVVGAGLAAVGVGTAIGQTVEDRQPAPVPPIELEARPDPGLAPPRHAAIAPPPTVTAAPPPAPATQQLDPAPALVPDDEPEPSEGTELHDDEGDPAEPEPDGAEHADESEPDHEADPDDHVG